QLLAGPRMGGGVDPGGVERLPRLSQLTPPFLIVLVAKPDVEIRVNPGARKDAAQCLGGLGTGFGHRDRGQFWMGGQALIKRAQKRTAPAFEVLPSVLAVEDHENRGFCPPAVACP